MKRIFNCFFIACCLCTPLSGMAQEDESICMGLGNYPVFPGGGDAMSWYIDSVMVYPEKEFREYVDGRVVATVAIDTVGVIADTRIVRSAGQAFDAEALE